MSQPNSGTHVHAMLISHLSAHPSPFAFNSIKKRPISTRHNIEILNHAISALADRGDNDWCARDILLLAVTPQVATKLHIPLHIHPSWRLSRLCNIQRKENLRKARHSAQDRASNRLIMPRDPAVLSYGSCVSPYRPNHHYGTRLHAGRDGSAHKEALNHAHPRRQDLGALVRSNGGSTFPGCASRAKRRILRVYMLEIHSSPIKTLSDCAEDL